MTYDLYFLQNFNGTRCYASNDAQAAALCSTMQQNPEGDVNNMDTVRLRDIELCSQITVAGQKSVQNSLKIRDSIALSASPIF